MLAKIGILGLGFVAGAAASSALYFWARLAKSRPTATSSTQADDDEKDLLNKRVYHLEAECKNLKKELAHQHTQITCKSRECLDLDEKLRREKETAIELKKKLDYSQKELDQNKIEGAQLADDVTQLVSSISRLEIQCDSLIQDLARKQTQSSFITEEYLKLDGKLRKKKEEVADLTKKLAKIDKEYDELVVEYNLLIDDYEILRKENGQLKEQQTGKKRTN